MNLLPAKHISSVASPCFYFNAVPLNEKQWGFSTLEILSPLFEVAVWVNYSGLFFLQGFAVLSAGGLFMTRHSAIWNLE